MEDHARDIEIDMPEEVEVARERVASLLKLLLPVVSGLLTFLGVSLDWAAIAEGILAVVTVALLLYCWYWKNNNWTLAAIIGQLTADEVRGKHARVE